MPVVTEIPGAPPQPGSIADGNVPPLEALGATFQLPARSGSKEDEFIPRAVSGISGSESPVQCGSEATRATGSALASLGTPGLPGGVRTSSITRAPSGTSVGRAPALTARRTVSFPDNPQLHPMSDYPIRQQMSGSENDLPEAEAVTVPVRASHGVWSEREQPAPPQESEGAARDVSSSRRDQWLAACVSFALLAARQSVAYATSVGESSNAHLILIALLAAAACLSAVAAALRAAPPPAAVFTLSAALCVASAVAFASHSLANGAHLCSACAAALLPLRVGPRWRPPLPGRSWPPLEPAAAGVAAAAAVAAAAWAMEQGTFQEGFTPLTLAALAALGHALGGYRADPEGEPRRSASPRSLEYRCGPAEEGHVTHLQAAAVLARLAPELAAEGRAGDAAALRCAEQRLLQLEAAQVSETFRDHDLLPLDDTCDLSTVAESKAGSSAGLHYRYRSPDGPADRGDGEYGVRSPCLEDGATPTSDRSAQDDGISSLLEHGTGGPRQGHRRSAGRGSPTSRAPAVRPGGRQSVSSECSHVGSNYVFASVLNRRFDREGPASSNKRTSGESGSPTLAQSGAGGASLSGALDDDDSDSVRRNLSKLPRSMTGHPRIATRPRQDMMGGSMRSLRSPHASTAVPSQQSPAHSLQQQPVSFPVDSGASHARMVTESTKELVRKVLDGGAAAAHGPARQVDNPFRNLTLETLQKLILLFGRLNEELDAFRAQQFIVFCVCEIVNCDRASIFLTEWKREEIWTITNEGHEIRVPMKNSLAGWAALHNEVLNIQDAQNDKRFNTEVDKQTGYLTRNMLVYPISRTGHGQSASCEEDEDRLRPIAVIQAINKNRGRAFSADDEVLLALMGKQAGIHLSNATLYNQLQLEGTKTKTLLEVTRDLNDVNVDLGEMMDRIMQRARHVLTVERATIFLLDEERQELWSALTDAETADKLRERGDDPQAGAIRVPVGVGLAGHVAVSGEVLNIKDAYQCDMFNPEYDRKTGYHTKSILVVPIKVGEENKIMGVIQFINKTNGDPFHHSDAELAATFSSFVGISLNNILMYEQLAEGKMVREQNRELKRLREAAEQAAEAKGNFLMAMSHEIRTPMSGVIGMCELLANTPMTSEQQEMLETIRNCGEALLAIINDVLDYGKIGSGKLELEQREFNIVSMLEETIDVIRSKTEAKSICLTLQADPTICPVVIGDNFRLRQIIINLVGNACKFTPEKGSIEIHVVGHSEPAPSVGGGRRYSVMQIGNSPLDSAVVPVAPEQWLRFRIKDTGIGISQAAQRRLFQPFEQAEAGTTRQYGGTGLGLAICKQLTEAMSGTIGIVSELGQGTEFWFTAKFGRPEQFVTLRELLRRETGPLAGLTLLLLCSHPMLRATVQELCELIHITVSTVDTLAEMQRVVEEEDSVPNILLVDEAADGVGSESTGTFLSALRARREKLGSAGPDGRSFLHTALMMNMGTKVEQGPALLEAGVSLVVSKPPKQKQLIKLFRMALPDAAGGKDQSAGQEQAERRQQLDMKLLVAEDNPTNQLLIKKQLKGFGIVPTICDNGQLAVDRLCQEYHNLVFMDCHMPVLDGYGASKRIRELEEEGRIAGAPGQPRITIVALTADALPQTRQVCLEHGMDDYATKPLRKAQLAAMLDKYWFKEDQ